MKKFFAPLACFLLAGLSAPVFADEQSTIDGGLYISGHGLVEMLKGTNEGCSCGNDHHEFDPGWGVTGAIGYVWAFPDSPADIRLELEGSYRKAPYDSIAFADGTFLTVDGDLEFLSGMVNLIVDFHIGPRFVPHLGVGLGRSQIRWRDIVVTDEFGVVTAYADSEEDVTMTQVMVGLGYRLSPGLIVDAEYRLFNPNDPSFNGLMANEYTVGFRMIF